MNDKTLSEVLPPAIRLRRLRTTPGLRAMVRETHLRAEDLIYPLFVKEGENLAKEVTSMPGVFQHSIDRLVEEARRVADLGIPAVMLFGIPATKDAVGSENFDPEGIVPRAIRALKAAVPELTVISDMCLCEYTDHGHCGILNGTEGYPVNPSLAEGYVLNDPTLDLLARASRVHAEAGADIIAPSGMLDGMVSAIREGLDDGGFSHVPVMSYAVKYASSYYGPFRDAAEGAPKSGDRKSHQMDPANRREALREAQADIEEGADFLMVKPALAYLDIIRTLSDHFGEFPLVAYNVSGEYSMVKAAAEKGWLDEKKVVMETLTGMKRAGADLIITYHAKDVVKWLGEP